MADDSVAGQRLDSWKAIAAYLHRDLTTVRRWEKSLGLPVRRVSGAGRGHSVFAYAREIDEWLQTRRATEPAVTSASEDNTPSTPPPSAVTGAARPWRLWVTAGALALTTLSVTWTLQTRAAAVAELRFEASATGVTAIDASERTRWRYRFPEGDSVTLLGTDVPLRVTLRGTPAVFVASAHSIGRVDEIAKAGVLTWLGTDGARHGSFAFDDDVVMEGKRYGSPWALTSFAIDETNGGRRVAVAGHHWTWDPGLVTVLDENWVRRGTFVHAGWIEGVRWLSRDRLVAAGFSNPQDGGMIALLDPSALDAALRMAVMPRSEVNRVTMSRFNRARVELIGDRIVVKTIEADTPANGDGAVDAVYEFSRDLELVSANFGDQYWAMHRALEEQGRLDHTREQCPDRDGPREVEMWEPATGWRMISLRPSG